MRARTMSVVLAAGLLATAVAGPAAAADTRETRETKGLKWAACPEDVQIDPLVRPQTECASVPVPLDYSKPKGKKIKIMISRIASNNPDKRRGVLMFNPGGPGGSGLGFPALMVSQGLPVSVLDSYDLIGMDTRGIGKSAPVSCGFTTDDGYMSNVPPYAPDDAAVLATAKIAKSVAAKCAKNDKNGVLKTLSTANMARDLDTIRAALGEKKTSFFGASYGSALGSAYASMFPERSDRIVLDSNVGGPHADQAAVRRYGLGFEETFGDFATWVAARHESYGLGRTPEEVRETYFETMERLDRKPAPDGTNGAMLRMAIFGGTYAEQSYGRTAQSWATYLEPETIPAAPAAPKGTPNPADNNFSVFIAVTCNDVQWPEGVDAYRQAVAEDRERYPLFGAASANIVPCAFWKNEPAEAPIEIQDEGATNVLILQNRHDPVTPLEGGRILDEKFGERSRLVTADGSGHGVYVLGRNACALNVTTSYLVNGTMPTEDVDCPKA